MGFNESNGKGGWRASRGLIFAGWLAVALIACGYLWFIRKNCAPYASNSDASSYLNCARLLFTGEPRRAIVPIEGLAPPEWRYAYYEPLGYRALEKDGTIVPMASVGYPLHLMAATPFVGLDWSVVMVNVIAVAGVGGLMVAVGRELGLSWVWALAGGAVLWASPVFVYIALQPMSDILATMWCLAAIAAGLRVRVHWAWGFAAGLSVGIAVLVRPTDALVMAPLALLLGGRWRAWLAVLAGGVPAAVFLIWYNRLLYGGVVATGYGDMSWAFGWKFVWPNLRLYAVEFPRLLSPVVIAAAAGLPWLWRGTRRQVVLLAVWFGAFAGFYFSCVLTGMAWSQRYLLPAFPAVIFAALLVGRGVLAKLPSSRQRVALGAGLLLLVLGWEVEMGRRLTVVIMKRGEIIYVQSAHWLNAHAEPDAVVVAFQASGALAYYTNFPVVRYDHADAAQMRKLFEATTAARRPVYAVLCAPEQNDAFQRFLSGSWKPLESFGMFTIWKRTGESGL